MPTNVEIPALGESVREAVLLRWHKADGDVVSADEPICELETDKANVDLPAPASGVLRRVKEEGDTVHIGETIARIDEGGSAPKAAPKPPASSGVKESPKPDTMRPSVRRMVEEHKLDAGKIAATGPGGKLTKEDVQKHLDSGSKVAAPVEEIDAEAPPPATPAPQPPATGMAFDADGVRRVPMSKIRKKIAERLVAAQHTAAILTTFNEIDMHNVLELRTKYKERFAEVHGISLGLMSFFARACVLALREFPRLNAAIDGDDVIYHQHLHLGIAVNTDRGLAVPVLRNVEMMSFAKIESEIKRLATATREGKLGLQELSGGTFTITNGGVFGSLLSTPILNPPQSGILGMHTIQKRPVAVNDQVVIRPMMYVALSYDHRLVDGKESVSFLVRLKELLEDPARLMLEI